MLDLPNSPLPKSLSKLPQKKGFLNVVSLDHKTVLLARNRAISDPLATCGKKQPLILSDMADHYSVRGVVANAHYSYNFSESN
jgi:hypothetical protein